MSEEHSTWELVREIATLLKNAGVPLHIASDVVEVAAIGTEGYSGGSPVFMDAGGRIKQIEPHAVAICQRVYGIR